MNNIFLSARNICHYGMKQDINIFNVVVFGFVGIVVSVLFATFLFWIIFILKNK